MIRRSFILALVSVVLLSHAGDGMAQPSAAERAAAEALFEQALKSMEVGQPLQACPKLEESQRLDPGVGTLLYLADCYRTVGRSASAWATFRQAAYAAKAEGQLDRQAIAEEQAAELKPKLSQLVLTVDGEPPPGLLVLNDGQEVGPALWGAEIPVDPGEHVVEAKATGKRPFSRTIVVPEGPAVTGVKIPVLSDVARLPVLVAPVHVPPSPPPPELPGSVPVRKTSTGSDGGNGSGQKTWGWVSLAGGGAALAGGGLFAFLAISDNTRADDHCRKTEPSLCGDRGIELGESASSKAQMATILTGVGGALAVTGVVLLLTAPSEHSGVGQLALAPTLNSKLAALRLQGSF